MYTYIAINSLLLSWGSYCWDRFASYRSLLSWGSFAGIGLLFTAFAKLLVPARTTLIMQPLSGFSSCQHEGMVGHVHRHFRILFVDSRFWGQVFKSKFFLGNETGLEKMDQNGFLFPFIDLLNLNILRQFRPFLPEEINI